MKLPPALCPVADLIGDDDGWRDWQLLMRLSEPFYWSDHTASLVTAASASYPLMTEESICNLDVQAMKTRAGESTAPPSYLPKRLQGVHVFQKPCLYVDNNGTRAPLSALAWNVAVSARTHELWLSIRGVMWTGSTAVVTWWSDGGPPDPRDDTVDSTFKAERIVFTKWICTAAMFIEQEIVTAQRGDVARGVRKRCAKADIEPICHVVNLRKELATERDSAGVGGVEWSHRWLVRGHWRRQFYPSRGGNAPVWIHPHVKGPQDKPFMEAKPTVYAVAR